MYLCVEGDAGGDDARDVEEEEYQKDVPDLRKFLCGKSIVFSAKSVVFSANFIVFSAKPRTSRWFDSGFSGWQPQQLVE